MVYQNKFVAAIKVSGRVLREVGNRVYIPFGSEYSILVKNLNSVRVQFKVQVDGTEMTDNTWIVVNPNSSCELERSIRNGNWNQGNRFKFIERTEAVEQHRGIKAEDGLVRIEYQTEVQPVYIPPFVPDRRKTWPPYERRRTLGGFSQQGRRASDFGLLRSMGPTGSSTPRSFNYPIANNVSFAGSSVGGVAAASNYVVGEHAPESFVSQTTSTNVSEAGITVEGSISTQSFVSVPWFQVGPSEVIVLELRGAVNGQRVREPITVKTRIDCKTCGKNSTPGTKFCPECGTSLQIV